MPSVKVKENEPFEMALRRFKRGCEKAGVLTETRRREFYEKPTAEGINTLVISGGVSANTRLREQAKHLCDSKGIRVFYPAIQFCTDNGAMIALAGALRLQKHGSVVEAGLPVNVRPRWPLAEL